MSAKASHPPAERSATAAPRTQNDSGDGAIASFLLALVKAMKGVQFYPEKHPALGPILGKCHAAAAPVLQAYNGIVLETRNQKVFHAGQPIAPELPEIRALAVECVHRRVRKFQIQDGVEAIELERFVRALTTPPDALEAAGGMERYLFEREVKRVSVNELNYQDLLYGEVPEDPQDDFFEPEAALAEEETEDDPLSLPEDATPLQEQLVKLLHELDAATEAPAYGDRAAALVSLVSNAAPPFAMQDVHRALRVLSSHASGREARPPELVPHALWALRELGTPPVIEFLLEQAMTAPPGAVAKLITLFGQMGSEIIPQLVGHLADAKVIHARRILATIIRGLGRAAVPCLLDVLDDERWYVIRNAVAILGEIGDPAAISSLEPLASSAEPRVAKEALRALGKIRHADSRQILERFLAHARGELQLLAAFALGVLRDPTAVPALAAMLPRRVIFTNFELQREVIKALAKIGTPPTVPPLERLFRRRSLLARAKNEELRLLAAQALARIDSDASRAILAAGVDSPNEAVAAVCRAARDAGAGKTSARCATEAP